MNDEVAAGAPHALDADNPWPGLDPFDERSRDFFHGRDREVEELAHRVSDAPVTVLFGKSGVGKTSLLRAGLFPRLRGRALLPVYVRLDVRPEAPPLVEQLRASLRRTLDGERCDAPAGTPGESLWEYLHRTDFEVWSERNALHVPVLVLDQFEEVFTLGERMREQVQRFQLELGDLAENRIPSALAADPDRADRLDLRRMRYKLVVTLREDFLPELEGWRRAMPSLGRARIRLRPMNAEQAFEAVHRSAAHLLDAEVAREIVRFVAADRAAATRTPDAADGDAGGGEIEPALLSLFCAGLNARRKQEGLARIDGDLLKDARQGIVLEYYRSCVEGLPDRVSRFIETELISEKGWRNSFAREDAVPAHLTAEELERLIGRRLLRVEERQGTQRIELSHDLLTRAVRDERDRRKAEAEKAELALKAEAQKAELARKAEAEKAELARRADEERRAREAETRALQEEFERRRQQALEAQLAREAAAARRFKRLALGLGVAIAVLLGMSGVAYWQRDIAVERFELLRRSNELLQHRTELLQQEWGSLGTRPAAAPADAEQRVAANVELQRLVERRAPSPAPVARVTILYFPAKLRTAAVDPQRVEAALRRLGFDVKVDTESEGAWPTNAIWAGSAIDLEDAKVVAYTLIRAGVELKKLDRSTRPGRDRVLQVGGSREAMRLPALTIEQIRSAKALPIPGA